MRNSILASILAVLLTVLLAPVFMTAAHAQDEDASTAEQAAANQQPPVPPVDEAGSQQQLNQAYQREYAFLEAQRRDLQNRLSSLQSRAAAEQSETENRIASLEGAYIGLQSRADRINDQLTDAEQQVLSAEEAQGALTATFEQAQSSLEEYRPQQDEITGFADFNDLQKIEAIFNQGLNTLNELSSVREEEGQFFLTDGSQVTGRVLRIGNVMAYGVSGDAAGALAPAGDQRLKLWPNSSAETARALVQGSNPETLDVFLFESLARPIEEQGDRSVLETINSGGTIAWIIVALGLLGLLLVILRVIFLQRASASTETVVDEVNSAIKRGDREAALQKLKKYKGATSRVVAAAIRNLDRDREHIEDIVSEAILHESSHLNRFGAFILVIAAVAPLLGLLGTVTGMIATFDIITEFGTGDPKLLSGGIAIALITTEIGLIVAIPTLIFGNLLSGWANRIKDDMQKGALRVINNYEKRAHVQVDGQARAQAAD